MKIINAMIITVTLHVLLCFAWSRVPRKPSSDLVSPYLHSFPITMFATRAQPVASALRYNALVHTSFIRLPCLSFPPSQAHSTRSSGSRSLRFLKSSNLATPQQIHIDRPRFQDCICITWGKDDAPTRYSLEQDSFCSPIRSLSHTLR